MSSELETRIVETGLRLYDLMEDESPSVFRKDYWMGKMMEWCMRDDAFKIEMFRFVDVFPYLTRTESIAGHLQEYFSRPDLDLPSTLQWGMKLVSPSSLTAKMIARSVAGNISSMAEQFIVGSSAQDALKKLERLRSQGMAFTVDLLGEAVVSEAEADAYLQRYLELLDILDGARRGWAPLGVEASGGDWGYAPMVNVSVKASAMYSQMHPVAFDRSIDRAKERLRPVLRKAIQTGAFVYLDMEHRAIKDLTLSLYRSLMEETEFRDYPHTGIVIQAYLRDSDSDLDDLIEWARKRNVSFTVRLVKGAYWDSEVIHAHQNNWPIPVFTRKQETDAHFEKLARIILENHAWVRLACASHNIRSIACVVETAKALKTPPDRVEYQVLYGMGEPVRNALTKAGLPVRLYTPVGDMIQGMSYLVRRLLENTANESFLRQSFAQHLSREELLRNPLDILKDLSTASPETSESREGPQAVPFQNEPLLDWSQAETRTRFEEALKTVRGQFPFKVPLLVAGRPVFTEKEIRSTNPNATHEIVGIVASGGEAEAENAVQAAKRAFPGWRDTAPESRAEYLFKAAQVARKMRYELAALQVYEVGKARDEADADVCEAIDFLEYYGREMLRLSIPRRMGEVPGEISHLFYEPRGTAVVIAPWNFPLAISMGMVSAAIVTGNTVVYKPASQSPVIGSMVSRIFEEAGLPAGVLNFLPGPGELVGDVLVTHPEVDLIAFTGSKEVGLRIVELAARSDPRSGAVKQVITEMGGKNAIILDSDADMDEAVVHVLRSAFGYQGQKCSACSRLIVLEENYERFVARLKAAAESLNLGSPEDAGNVVGAVIDASAQKKIMEYIGIGKQEGTLLLERPIPGSGGHFTSLAIFTGILPEHRLAREEIFGPVLAVMKARDFGEALALANGTSYALTGAVFSRSPANIARASREFRTGNLYINRGCTGAVVGRHPFGGFKLSGMGSKTGGPDYLLQFMVPRNVVENTLRRGFAPLDV